MSFFERAARYPSSRYLAQAVRLAAGGSIAEAVKIWKFHKEQAGLCICGLNTFDQVRCGYCFTGKLLSLELEHGPFVDDVDFLGTARQVQAFIGALKAEAVPDEAIPAELAVESRTS